MYKESQKGAVAKSYMRKGFLIYDEMRNIYEEAFSHIWLCNFSFLNFLTYEENCIFFLISVVFFYKSTKNSHCNISSTFIRNTTLLDEFHFIHKSDQGQTLPSTEPPPPPT